MIHKSLMNESNYSYKKILEKTKKINYSNKQFYEKINIQFGERIIDLLLRNPLDYIIRKLINVPIEAKHLNKFHSIDITVESYIESFSRKLPFTVISKNSFGQEIKIIFFNIKAIYIKNSYKIGEKYRVTGNIEYYKGQIQLVHPESCYNMNKLEGYEFVEPVYNLNRIKINRKKFRKLIKENINVFKNIDFPKEWIDKDSINNNSWESFKNSLINLHDSKSINIKEYKEKYRRRLAYDEILSNFLIISFLKRKLEYKKSDFICKKFIISNKLIKELDFKLTKGQSNSYKEICNDIKSLNKMFRLIQGDVGSGKTIVALLAIANIVDSGFQAALMAPTEILALQHYNYFKEYFHNFNIKIELLTGKNTPNEKKVIFKKLENHEIDIIIGTHSLYNKNIKFKSLGMIVIDEQHKFGVNQRLNLQNKSPNSHVLIMSATPIPRSLTFAVYGEIDISIIKDKPIGRKEIVTSIISNDKINELIIGIKRKINNNEKVFWVLPEIGKNEINQINNESIVSRYEYLNKIFYNQVDFIHGKIKKEEIAKKIDTFKNGKTMILVSTTVIEVGVDIPNASIIVIENANKFGLAQLHQLRGRIGRGELKSNCVMIHNNNLSVNGKERLLIMKKSNDGFFIAEQDLNLRGGGEIFGLKQTGLPSWRFFNPYFDIDLIDNVRNDCKKLFINKLKYKDQINFLTTVFFRSKEIENYFTG